MKLLSKLKNNLSQAAFLLLFAIVTSNSAWAAQTYTMHFFYIENNEPHTYFELQKTHNVDKQINFDYGKRGYTFLSWEGYCFYNNNYVPLSFQVGDYYTYNAELFLTANLRPNTYTMVFHANGGTGTAMDDLTYTYDQTYTLPSCTYTKEGYIFLGWTTEEDGSGQYFYNKQSVSNITYDDEAVINLYAQWTDCTGTSDNPYIISNDIEWNLFASRVNEGLDVNKYYRLTADIGGIRPYNRLQMMGTNEHPFSGRFDGQGHEITVDYEINETGFAYYYPLANEVYALFRYAKNASFVNLTTNITVDVYRSGPMTYGIAYGGFIGRLQEGGNASFVACRSFGSPVFLFFNEGTGDRYGSMAGYIGAQSANSTATFLNCSSNPHFQGMPFVTSGFVGYSDNCTATFTNCRSGLAWSPYVAYDIPGMQAYYNGDPYPYVWQYPFVYYSNHNIEHYNNCYRAMTDEDCERGQGASYQGTHTNNSGIVVPDIAPTRSIIVSPSIEHGSLVCPSEAVPGELVMVKPIPEEGYHLVNITYNDGTNHTISLMGGEYQFVMPDADITLNATFAVDADATAYIAFNTTTQLYETKYFSKKNISNITSSTTTLGADNKETKYKVTGNVTVSNRITVRGTVHLVLCDGAMLTAEKGITVNTENTLNIYGQTDGTGTLNATGALLNGDGTEAAAIGSTAHTTVGTITIHGGIINATNYAWTAGIGGGVGGGGGSINLYGGTVSATATNPNSAAFEAQEAIGKGSSGGLAAKTIIDGLRVYTDNNSTPEDYTNRERSLGVSSFRGKTIIRTEPCTEHNYVDNVCTYCGVHHHHSITYNGNGNTGGTVPAVATFNVDGITTATGIVADEGDLVRNGYSFLYWNTEADGSGTSYAPGATITLGNDITLYAQWRLVQYYITYDLAGGETKTPNPGSYTITSGNITLNKPTRTDYDENDAPTYFAFKGWTGTGLDSPTMNVTIYHGSTGDRTYTATWEETLSPFPGMDADTDFEPNQLGYYYVRMARDSYGIYDEDSGEYTEITPAEDNPKIVDIPEGFNYSFKVYDDGGKDGNYLSYEDSYYIYTDNTLTLTCPEGFTFYVQGTMNTEEDYDYLTIYDGDSYGYTDILLDMASGAQSVGPFSSSGNIITFYFEHDGEDCYSGFDLTVTLVAAPPDITLANDDSEAGMFQKNTTIITTNNGESATVTIDGRTIYTDGRWNTLCLPFDINNISKTPLNEAIIKQPSSIEFSENGTLTMNFTDANTIEAGKPYLVRWDFASPYYYVTDGSTEKERLDKDLVDGYSSSEWWPDEKGGAYCVFEADGIMEVTGYVLTTGYEHLRNPEEWKLEGKLNESDDWTLIDHRDVDVTPDDALPNATGTDKYYSATTPGTYRYFRFTIIRTEVYTCFSELTLEGVFYTDYPEVSIVENPTFKAVTIHDELQPFTDNGFTFGGNYSSLSSTNNLLLDTYNTDGHAFHAALNLPDVTWYTDAECTIEATTLPFDPITGSVTLYAKNGHNAEGYGDSNDGWMFIASPVVGSIDPSTVVNLLGSQISDDPVLYDYDLYRFNQSAASEWENYHQHDDFLLENGKGYLYARKDNNTLFFEGEMNTDDTKTVDLDYDENARLAGYNLVGNPFPCEAYVNRPFYRMNDAGDDIEPVANYDSYTPTTIPPYTGIIVKANRANESVKFTTSAPETSSGNNGSLSITLSQQAEATRDGSATSITHDKAFVSFNQGSQLGKFVFNQDHAKLYIPQGNEDYAIVCTGRDGACTVSTGINEFPVNFKATKNGTYTITVNPEGVEMSYLHLIDNLTGTDIDLLQTPSYTFEGKTTDYASRFKLVFSARKSIEEIGDNEPFAFIHDGEIIIESDGIVQVIDMLGRIIVQRRDGACTVSTKEMTPGVYVLRLIDGEKVRTQKIVIK